jgi:hypothetical protein
MRRTPIQNRWARLAGAGVILVSGSAAWGCASCFGASDSAMARGMNVGIFALLGVIGFVLSAIVGVAVSLALRASRVARARAVQAGVEDSVLDVAEASRLMRLTGRPK